MSETAILDRIVAARRVDLEHAGPEMGCILPKQRERPSVPFLSQPGAILEIKRASPSKGLIAADLDPAVQAHLYAAAGAHQISVLTENNYFKGTIGDLLVAASAEPTIAFLRKDFLLEEAEIEVSWRAGADAVLLIARILDELTLRRLARLCRSFGMTPFVEVRGAADVDKLAATAADGPTLAGVNARDLATFAMDPLIPAALFADLSVPAVYESGIDTPLAAAYARRLGYRAILVGEAVARDAAKAAGLVSAFLSARADGVGAFWRAVAERKTALPLKRPLVKICGLTGADDAVMAAGLGADLLGFVFADSPRRASAEAVAETLRRLTAPDERPAADSRRRPLLVGVITDHTSNDARTALRLAREGVLDAIQYHGDLDRFDELDAAIGSAGRYAAVRIGGQADIDLYDRLRRNGEPRVLADAKAEGLPGGSGQALPDTAACALVERGGLWLAGGLGPGAVGAAMDRYRPELIDASSKLEVVKGKKDPALLSAYFKEIQEHAN